MFVGSFSLATSLFSTFQTDVVSAINNFKAAGVTNLLIDLTNNGGTQSLLLYLVGSLMRLFPIGGFVCLGAFLFQYLSGSKIGYA